MDSVGKKKTKKKTKKAAVKVEVMKMFGRKAGYNKPLTTPEREQLFALYVVNPIVEALQRLSGVSSRTIAKVRDEDKWDKRREEVLMKSRRIAGSEMARMIAKNDADIQLCIKKLMGIIRAGKKIKSQSTFADFDRMVRLRQFNLGNPDAHLAVGRFDQMSDEDLEKKLVKMKACTGDVQEGGE